MEELKYGKLVDFVHMLIKQSYYNKNNLSFIDATCGNGFDTLFLCKLAGSNGHVKAFDIQPLAVEKTASLLKSNLEFINYEIFLNSHEFIPKYLTGNIDAAIFNLGYLPNSDKTVMTKGSATVKAVENLIPYLKNDGKIYLTTYITHDTGNEFNEVYNYLSNLDKSKYNVINIKLINKNKKPPELFIIEKNA